MKYGFIEATGESGVR